MKKDFSNLSDEDFLKLKEPGNGEKKEDGDNEKNPNDKNEDLAETALEEVKDIVSLLKKENLYSGKFLEPIKKLNETISKLKKEESKEPK